MGRICIRVDGNEIIATGHVMRCLSVAEQLRKKGAQVLFVLADMRPASMIEDKGFEYHVLDSVWNRMDSETEKFCHFIQNNSINTILLDSYYVTKEYLEGISKIARVCYIDDLDKFIYPVHTLINYSLQYDRNYEERYAEVGMSTRFLLGGKYAPLREEFKYESFIIKNQVEKVLITTGGTDQLNMTFKLLALFLDDPRLRNLEYNVIVGKFNDNKIKLKELSKKIPNIIIHENISNMSYWMRACDVAVTAAGTTTFELSACGIPSICFEVADNQMGARLWEQRGYMFYAGNAFMQQEECLNTCRSKLLELCENDCLRKKMSTRMQELVDGLGAIRIADYLIKLSEEN